MINKEMLKDYANKLMFDMSDSEYDTLIREFDVMLKHMDIIESIEGLDEIEPMTFPFINMDAKLRDDVSKDILSEEEVISNAKNTVYNEIQVPRVVEE